VHVAQDPPPHGMSEWLEWISFLSVLSLWCCHGDPDVSRYNG
jgi:hypothetical protein